MSHKTPLNVIADYLQFKKKDDVYRSTLQLINISTASLKAAATQLYQPTSLDEITSLKSINLQLKFLTKI
jgi:hypothetical protein